MGADSKVIDAWDQPYVIKCDKSGEIQRVTSGGPDKKQGTADDLIVRTH
jgi:hypothetical protein